MVKDEEGVTVTNVTSPVWRENTERFANRNARFTTRCHLCLYLHSPAFACHQHLRINMPISCKTDPHTSLRFT